MLGLLFGHSCAGVVYSHLALTYCIQIGGLCVCVCVSVHVFHMRASFPVAS